MTPAGLEPVRLAVITDAHGNLPAMRAVIATLKATGYDAGWFTGDAVVLGPQPREVIELLTEHDFVCIQGNHDAGVVARYLGRAGGHVGEPTSAWDILEEWVVTKLDPDHIAALASWPLVRDITVGETLVRLTHYPHVLESGSTGTAPRFRRPGAASADFHEVRSAGTAADLLCVGHDHVGHSPMVGEPWFNPGALGCGGDPVASYGVIDVAHGRLTCRRSTVAYDASGLADACTRARVPELDVVSQFLPLR